VFSGFHYLLFRVKTQCAGAEITTDTNRWDSNWEITAVLHRWWQR